MSEWQKIEGGSAPPTFAEILLVVGQTIDPNELISALSKKHAKSAVIEGIQRALEQEAIFLDDDAMVAPVFGEGQ